MAMINLLPWRAERRREREREFYAMLGAAAVAAILVWLLWGFWMNMRTENQEARNAYLSGEIAQLDDKIVEIKKLEDKRHDLVSRKEIIERLQASRSQMVHLFDELVKTIPEGTRLSSLKQTGDQLTLQGVAQANGNVAAYMRNLDSSDWLQHSDLQKTEVKGTYQRNRYEFGVTVKMHSPDIPDAPEPVKPAATTPGKPVAKPANPATGGKP
jgi:type IV pilus assembly protein PilN